MEGDRFHLGPEEAAARCDENTIGVVAILGSTFDGSYEPVKAIAATGCSRSTPPATSTAWSIPASAGRCGRSADALPRDLVFDVNYLGGHMPTFALNFSRPGSEVVAQYYMFTTLGRDGYRRVMQGARDVARHLSSEIAKIGPYRLISEGNDLPVFAFALAPEVENYSVFDISDRLRQRGWLVPAYTFPENRQDLSVLRIVVRAGMTHDMADHLLDYLREQTKFLESLKTPLPDQENAARTAFSHN